MLRDVPTHSDTRARAPLDLCNHGRAPACTSAVQYLPAHTSTTYGGWFSRHGCTPPFAHIAPAQSVSQSHVSGTGGTRTICSPHSIQLDSRCDECAPDDAQERTPARPARSQGTRHHAKHSTRKTARDVPICHRNLSRLSPSNAAPHTPQLRSPTPRRCTSCAPALANACGGRNREVRPASV